MIIIEPRHLDGDAARLLLSAEAQASTLPMHASKSDYVSEVPDSVLADVAAHELKCRAQRFQHLPAGLSGEGWWEILLELFVSGQKRQPISLSQACAASRMSQSTAVRYIAFLIVSGFAERSSGIQENKMIPISLTAMGTSAIRATLREYAQDVSAIVVD